MCSAVSPAYTWWVISGKKKLLETALLSSGCAARSCEALVRSPVAMRRKNAIWRGPTIERSREFKRRNSTLAAGTRTLFGRRPDQEQGGHDESHRANDS